MMNTFLVGFHGDWSFERAFTHGHFQLDRGRTTAAKACAKDLLDEQEAGRV